MMRGTALLAMVAWASLPMWAASLAQPATAAAGALDTTHTPDTTVTPIPTRLVFSAPARWVVGKRFALYGRLEPTMTGAAIGLYVRVPSGWRRVGTTATDARGRFRFGRLVARPGRVSHRVRFGGDTSATPSGPVTLTPSWSPPRSTLVRYVVLRAVGDVNLGDGPAVRMAAYGADYPWRRVGSYLRAADIAFANLECAVSGRGSPEAKKYTFRGSRSALRAARSVGGIDIVSLANNHTRDFGLVAFADTLDNLRRERLLWAGAGEDAHAAHQAASITKDGLSVAFLAYSTIEDDRWRATRTRGGVASAFPVSQMKRDVASAARRADVVVVSFHWGIELMTTPEAEQVMLGKAAVDAGADLILGHHPHCLQPIKRYRGRPIAYSLGNFVFAPPATPDINKRTLVLTADLSGRGVAAYRTRRAYIYDAQPRFAR